MEFKEIENKWQKKWEDAKIFEANPTNQEKFFVSFPYPYINGYSHIGHLYTLTRVDAFARYKRLKGYNVLFPQGWHATGSPIVNAAKRVKEKEKTQIKIMKEMGFSDEQIIKFEDPKYWIEFFAPEFKKDYSLMGMSIDWRRNFTTTDIDPYYDKFIKWQFNKLKAKGYVIKGKFPVVWDPVEECAVGDHGRSEGEGETPQEFCLFKFQLEDGRFVITATLRPDTVMGITNIYINPQETYSEIDVKGEHWIVGKPMVTKLKFQKFEPKIITEIKGENIVGQDVKTFSGLKIPILPASFLDSNYGTGIVHSVPSDSADDMIALTNIQKDNKTLDKFNLDKEKVKAIKPIAVFDTPEIGEFPAQFFINKYGVKSQDERSKLEKIKKELYTLTFNKSTYNEKYSKIFSQDLQGKLVKDGQEIIKQELIKQGAIHKFYELTGRVISRGLIECVVKIVDNQWFIDYNNKEWKALAHKCLDNMKLYPEKARSQFNYVIDWLHEWACTRKSGLGTRLPWDEKWLIESLSDSTIYMSYYTIAHLIKDLNIDDVDDELFDYILLNKGSKPDVKHIDEMKDNFEYYYPVDFRNSGKDLIQNHLTFFIFNHVAIFPEDKWPKGIGANGWVTVDGQKMSKSLGNMIPLREVADKFGVDTSRITILSGGEEIDDPNWDSELAKSIAPKLISLIDFSKENYNKHSRTEITQIDKWMESEMNKIIKEAENALEETLFRTAIQKVYFNMQRALKYYTRRTDGNMNKNIVNQFIENQIIMLSPITPHICEEAWETINKEGFASAATWPVFDESKINEKIIIQESYFNNTISDIRTVQELAKVPKPSSIRLFISLPWKYELFDIVKQEFENQNRDFKSILGKVMSVDNIKNNGKQVTKILPMLLKKGLPEFVKYNEEFKVMNELKDSIAKEFNCVVEVIKAIDSQENKAKNASPGKPAILVE